MTVTAILGGQWGDEGKGKIVDLLAGKADAVVRYQGGANAGHTVVVGEEVYKLHLLPAGALHPDKLAIIGNGVVLDPVQLLSEIDQLGSRGLPLEDRLQVSERAHVVLPYHKSLDGLHEAFRGAHKIDTTRRGIGPAYTDKVARMGIRMGELVRPEMLRQRLEEIMPARNAVLQALGGEPMNAGDIFSEFSQYGERLRPYVTDTVLSVQHLLNAGKQILLEGAQGGLLDIDFGTYPYVTSSSTSAGGIATGVGIPLRAIDRVLGVYKAYQTRVGAGPMPTEETGEMGDRMRDRGQEYGTTTGRPRRCGWFDAVAARWVASINGVDSLALTKLDVLGCVDELRICVAYEMDGQRLEGVPAHAADFARVEPIYETMAGWRCDISAVRRREDLPDEAQAYCRRLEELVGAPCAIISTGAPRDASIHCPQG